MNQRKFYLFRIDMKYVRDLHNVDSRVISVSPQLHKEKRVFLGIVVLCNSREYIIPLSHPKEKHQKMKPKADFDKIVNKNGKLLGVLNYNLMIPVNNCILRGRAVMSAFANGHGAFLKRPAGGARRPVKSIGFCSINCLYAM